MAEAKVYISGPIVADSSEAGNAYPYATLEDVMMQLEYQKPFTAVRAIINSPGGRVDKGMAMYDYFRSMPGVTVTTEAIGQCSSIATAVFLAGSVRIAHPHTESLVHLPIGGISGVTADEAQAWADEMARCEGDLLALYVERAGVDEAAFREVMRAQTTLVGQQLMDNGFATQILQPATALAIVPTSSSSTSADADQVPGWAQQLMSKFNLGLAAMTTALNTLRKPAINQANTEAATALDVVTDGGDTLSIDTGDRDTYEVGDTVTGSDGTAPADADYALTDGNTITLVAGAITAINPTDATDKTASADVNDAIAQIAQAVTALAGEVRGIKNQQATTASSVRRIAAATGSSATAARASAASDEGKEADADPAKAASDARAARRANRYPKQ